MARGSRSSLRRRERRAKTAWQESALTGAGWSGDSGDDVPVVSALEATLARAEADVYRAGA
jgi:hypothetical protein